MAGPRALHVSAAAVAALVGLLLAYLPRAPPQEGGEGPAVAPAPFALEPAEAAAAPGRLAAALALPTLSSAAAPNHVPDPEPFRALHALLRREFPLVFQRLEAETVNEHSLLLTWRGRDPALRPLLALSHLDVVPAEPPTNWTHPPFGGVVADGWVWGRGALDIKVTALQQLEAVAALLRAGHAPARTLLLAFGHDEEVGGERGAAAIAELLRARGVEAELVLDEGGAVMVDGFGELPSGGRVVAQPVAFVGTAEKGYETWELEVRGTGGHSGMPPTDLVATRIGRVLAALAQPTPTQLGPPVGDMLRALAPGVRLAPLRVLLQAAPTQLLGPVLGQLMGQAGPSVQPLVRTTCAVVAIQASGGADNVLPATGTLRINCRVLPGQEAGSVERYLRAVTRGEAAHVTLRAVGAAAAPPPVAPAAGPHWELVRGAVLEALSPPPPAPRLLVAPYMLGGMTDSRWYACLAGGRVYRFAPYHLTAATLATVHGVDERIEVADYLRGIGFYARVFERGTGDEGSEEAAGERRGGGGGGGDGGGGGAATAA